MTTLIIVESPNKVKKIQSFLGDNYTVTASKGHIRNLDDKDLGIDLENNYEPKFIDTPDKKDVIKNLKKLAKSSTKIILCSDNDREGSAIAWHCAEICGLQQNQRHRAVFTEITKKAITQAINNPSMLNMNEVQSQFARMVLDKLLGYKISPLLWKEFKNYHLSAGRVQSPVVRIITEREEEINKFTSSSFFKTNSNIVLDEKELKSKKPKLINCILEDNITEQSNIENIMKSCIDNSITITVTSLKKNNTKRNPSPPYTTSTMQQDASAKLGMSPDICMKNAQKLYEAGFITYMRTDAVFIAEEAMKSMETFIINKWGDHYAERRLFKNKSSSAQEAHECCRPTDINRLTVLDVENITVQQNKLYQMIWKRTLASQMAPADIEIRTAKFNFKQNNQQNTFTAKHEKIIFDGFLAVYNLNKNKINEEENIDEEDIDEVDHNNNEYLEQAFTKMKEGDIVFCYSINSKEKHTKPTYGRYTEASLIKKLDELGIGRPSTYASMVHKVQEEQRQYVERKSLPPKPIQITTLDYIYNKKNIDIKSVDGKLEGDKNKLFPTPLGIMINSYLVKNFTELMSYEFTANIESLLDDIAQGNKIWYKVVDSVYMKLNPIIDQLTTAVNTNKTEISTKKLLGHNPANNLPIYAMRTKLGYAICESHTDPKKSRFANFTTPIEDMNLDTALKLLIYPINLGKYNEHDILIKKAKNIYISYNDKNYSIDIYNKNNTNKLIDPNNITYLDAINLINYRDQPAISNDIQINNDIIIKNGIHGPYIKYKGKDNISIPSKFKKEWESLNLIQCNIIIEKHLEKKGKNKPVKNDDQEFPTTSIEVTETKPIKTNKPKIIRKKKGT